ncbi:molybdopterin molybdenumtransferase [Oxobacter pfennigii]|uniref:Molybdopterin molybdenumtransferase n=1 Tax=Oxobacter pfennigii TaxID=36849 RepID=A0A0P8WWT3_9CLOT|nr:molybdopterin molybdenumtransferase [Oxobacter pfennigii]
MQNVYLSNYELNEAIDTYFERLGTINKSTEKINTWDGLGRVTAQPVYSLISSPHYNSSAMDGIATLSEKTFGASERNHIELIENKDYVVVDTGDPIPKEFDCVIMVEDLIRTGKNKVKIYNAAIPWQNIRPIGEDIVESQLIVPTNHKIRPVDIGAMIAGGVNEISVYKKPMVGIIPTGTELVEPGAPLKVGDIIDFNSRVFMSQVDEWGGIPKRYEIVKDDYDEIKSAVKRASKECDIVLINAGSSAGREDYTSSAISDLGDLIIHGVAIKPGKPVMMGIVNNKPIIGIPGYPVSAYFIMDIIAKRLINEYLSYKAQMPSTVMATLTRRVMSSLKYHEFVRMKLGYIGDKFVAAPLSRGAGATMSLVKADGVLEIPQHVEGLEAGTEVKISLMTKVSDIKNTIVCIGSHDPIIDTLSDMLHKNTGKYFLSSAHVGSMGGITALKNEETHIAPIHLLDMDTGEYNISYIKKYIPDKDICIIKCVKRIQGFMVRKENPLNIKDFTALQDKSIRFVNRQRGSGTRLLLDYNLKKLNIEPRNITGYQREEFTHLAVAAAVANDDADCGLGVYSAAILMGLDFIPVCNEEYDIAISQEYMEQPMIKELLSVLKSREFFDKLDELGGYDYSEAGKIIDVERG